MAYKCHKTTYLLGNKTKRGGEETYEPAVGEKGEVVLRGKEPMLGAKTDQAGEEVVDAGP